MPHSVPARLLRFTVLFVFSFALAFAVSAEAQEADQVPESETPHEAEASSGPLAGHSYHGDVFNEGPRQAAYLMQGTGNVHFPVTCASPEAQQFFDQGVGQLHGFWYFESERSFRQVAQLDPECAMAYWGMAMSNRGNAKRARGFIEEAVKRRDQATPLERKYIDSLAKFFKEPARKEGEKVDREKQQEEEKKRRQTLVKDYENILHEFPNEIEARALIALSLYENRSKGIPISSYYAVDALLKSILAENPLHPCHHYVIHLWDLEEAKLALESAAKCGASAPAIAHMWHMPGHIYSRLKRYHDAVWQQEASARCDHAYMQRDRVLPDQIHNYAHNNEWLIRNLIFIGDVDAALALSKNMIDLPRHPKLNTLSRGGSSKFGRLRLLQTLVTFQLWEEVLKLADTIYLEPTDIEEEQLKSRVLIAVARFQTGDVMTGCDALTSLKEELRQLETEQQQAADTARAKAVEEQKEEKEQASAAEQAKRPFATRIRNLTQAVHELEGHLHLAHGATTDAIAAFNKVPTFDKCWLAALRGQSGETEEAIKAIEKEIASRKGEVVPLAWKTVILAEAEQLDAASKSFEQLRELSSAITLDSPLFARLAPIAQKLELPTDWRLARTIPTDFGERPDLASLGPFAWSPTPATRFDLPNQQGERMKLAQFAGRPVVVVFYLGHGCLHCVEQLQKFAPEAENFRQAGIDLVAISTDQIEDLKFSYENYGKAAFPFPLAADPELQVFKQYRCFDDFEQQPLHGTFLIDGAGLVRWLDIGHEPFMDVEFLLKESKRLLSQPVAPTPDERPGVTAIHR